MSMHKEKMRRQMTMGKNELPDTRWSLTIVTTRHETVSSIAYIHWKWLNL